MMLGDFFFLRKAIPEKELLFNVIWAVSIHHNRVFVILVVDTEQCSKHSYRD